MEHDIGVLIPAHNEERTIGPLVARLRTRFDTVLVVDDGSTDRTALEAEAAGALVERHPVCRGKGAALETGFAFYSRRNVRAVITMDGDGQHLPEETDGFVSAFRRRSDVAIWVGTRDLAASEMPLLRRVTNLAMSLLISLVALRWIPDTQSGFRLFRADVLPRLRVASAHFEAESEILIRASRMGLRIGRVRISTVYGSERSKIRAVRDTLRFFRMLAGMLAPHGGSRR